MPFGLNFFSQSKKGASATRVEMDIAAPTLEATVQAAQTLIAVKSREAKLDTLINQFGCKADGTTGYCRRTPECGDCVLG